MQRNICQYHKRTTKRCQTDAISPKRKDIEAKGGQDGGTGYLDVDAVLVVNKRKIAYLVHNKALEAIVED